MSGGANAPAGGTAVLVDSNFGITRVLRPYEGFEANYQDKSGDTPIAIPGNLDPNPGKEGFSPYLLAGISVALGSKVMLWLPSIAPSERAGEEDPPKYIYSFIWRFRSIQDYVRTRQPWHFPLQSKGARDEFVVPACTQSVCFQSPKVFGGVEFLSQTSTIISKENYIAEAGVFYGPPDPLSASRPILPDKNPGEYQQGILNDPNSNSEVTFSNLQVDALGDELIILVSKTTKENWDFTFRDRFISEVFGGGGSSKASGIYLLTGSNP